MKKILCLFVAIVMILAMVVSCGDTKPEESKPSESQPAASQPDESTPEASEPEASEPEASKEESKEESVEASEPDESKEESSEESSEEEDDGPLEEGPVNYIWLVKDNKTSNTTVLTYRIDGEEFAGKSVFRVFADVCFENVVATAEGGCAYVNLYFWNSNDELIDFVDWACSKDDKYPGQWDTYDFSFEVTDKPDFAYATIGLGFYNAEGKLYCGPINISTNKEMFWNRSFSSELDLDDPTIVPDTTFNITEDNLGLTYEVVFQSFDSIGHNLLKDEGVDITVSGKGKQGHVDQVFVGQYTGSLNDGVIGAGDCVPEWYGFNPAGVAEEGSIDDNSGLLGTIICDLGEEKSFNRIRLFYWGPEAGYGVGGPVAIRAYYSADGEEWTEFSDLLFDSTVNLAWADTEERDPVSAQFVKVEYLYVAGNWGMVSELEIIGAAGEIIE